MTRRFFMALACLLGLLTTACGSTQLSPEQLSTMKRVAVVSAVGDELTIIDFDMIPITTTDEIGSIKDLGLDDQIAAMITKKLRPRFELANLDKPIEVTGGDKREAWFRDENHTTIIWPKQDVDGNPIDTYIAVTPATVRLFNVNHQIHGAFMVHHPHMFDDGERVLGISYHLRVIEGRSGKTLGDIPVNVGKDIDRSFWAPTVATLTDAQKRQIAATLLHDLDWSLGDALRKLNLTP